MVNASTADVVGIPRSCKYCSDTGYANKPVWVKCTDCVADETAGFKAGQCRTCRGRGSLPQSCARCDPRLCLVCGGSGTIRTPKVCHLCHKRLGNPSCSTCRDKLPEDEESFDIWTCRRCSQISSPVRCRDCAGTRISLRVVPCRPCRGTGKCSRCRGYTVHRQPYLKGFSVLADLSSVDADGQPPSSVARNHPSIAVATASALCPFCATTTGTAAVNGAGAPVIPLLQHSFVGTMRTRNRFVPLVITLTITESGSVSGSVELTERAGPGASPSAVTEKGELPTPSPQHLPVIIQPGRAEITGMLLTAKAHTAVAYACFLSDSPPPPHQSKPCAVSFSGVADGALRASHLNGRIFGTVSGSRDSAGSSVFCLTGSFEDVRGDLHAISCAASQ